jgi:hypothetical protein
MRYEHLTLDISTAALDELRLLLAPQAAVFLKGGTSGTPRPVHLELMNLFNEIEARLQRRDQDPKATDPNTDLTS